MKTKLLPGVLFEYFVCWRTPPQMFSWELFKIFATANFLNNSGWLLRTFASSSDVLKEFCISLHGNFPLQGNSVCTLQKGLKSYKHSYATNNLRMCRSHLLHNAYLVQISWRDTGVKLTLRILPDKWAL